jgi:hypothetical protein
MYTQNLQVLVNLVLQCMEKKSDLKIDGTTTQREHSERRRVYVHPC